MRIELDALQVGDLLIWGNSDAASFLIVEVRKGRWPRRIAFSQKLTAPRAGLYQLVVYDNGQRIMWYDPQFGTNQYVFTADFEIVRAP